MRIAVPFRFKLFAIGALTLLAALTALGASQWFLVERTLGEQLRQRAEDERPLLRAALAGPLAERDYAAVHEILRESVTGRGLVYLVLVDANGRVLERSGDVDERSLPRAGPEHGMSPGGNRFVPFEDRIAIGDQVLAHLHYGLSTRPFDEASSHLLARAAVVAVVSLLVSILLMEVLHARLTAPLRRLGEASQRVRGGDYEVELERGADDEIGRLTEDFRHMIVEVRNRVTALTQAESRLRALLDEAGVRERELNEARREAEAASLAKSRFLAKMSHEIRTPLNGVLGMLELLRDDDLAARQRRYVALAHESGRHLLEIVEDVLDFSRIEAGRIRIESTPFDARALFADVVELFTPLASGKGIELTLRFGTMPAMVQGDSGRCRQILGNLIGNAIKFTHTGSVVVDAWCAPRPAEGTSTLHCRVTDTGIGIAPDALERLFAPFVQVDDSNTRRYGGTGLGLAISRGLAQAMGGNIRAESKPGEGSTFEVELPVKIPDPGLVVVGPRSVPVDPVTLYGRTVLLVEDNPVNRIIAEEMLRGLGCGVVSVETGLDGVAAESAGHFDAILLDLQLPDIDGFEVARRLKAGWASRGTDPVPIVALTANAFHSDRERCRAEGMQGFVSKPCTQAELARVLSELVPA